MDYVIFNKQKFYIEEGKLNLNHKGISDLKQIENIENLTYLKELDLQQNNLTYLNGFGNHQYLKIVQLNDNKIEKIETLEGLENLEELNLSNNELSEINGLEKLRSLKKLYIFNNNINEINGLDKLINIEELNLTNNKIKQIKGLENLKNLRILVLAYNEIDKIEGLEKLENIKELHLGKNKIEEIDGLNDLINLVALDLRGNKINKISGLNYLNKLRYLRLDGNEELQHLIKKFGGFGPGFVNFPYNYVKYCRNEYVILRNDYYFIADRPEDLLGFKFNKNILSLQGLGIRDLNEIEGLENLTHLEGLMLNHNQITNIKGLEKLGNLKLLWLGNNKINEITGLEELQELKELLLGDNEIEEIDGLDRLVNLQKLNLRNNKIIEIKGLDHLQKLKELSLRDNKIEEIKGFNELIYLELLFLKNNKINEIKNLSKLQQLKQLSLVNNEIEEIKNLENLKNLETLSFSGNKEISKIKGLSNLTNLKELIISDTSISKIENLDNLLNLKKLHLKNNKISKIEGLENLLNLNYINLDINEIEPKLLKSLKIDNSARLLVSYCILKPIIENIKDKIIWSDLRQEHPYIDKLNFKYLNIISKSIQYVEVLRQNGDILSIVSPEYLVRELDKLLIPRSENDELEYELISQELKLKKIDSAKILVNYVLDNDLSEFSLYKTKNGIKKASTDQIRHQLAIFDAPNQRFFFSRNSFELRINQLEGFISSHQKPQIQVFKFAFINDEVYKGGNAAGINFLDKNARWNLISVSKEKKEDVDAKIETFVVQINKLYSRSWDSIYVISSDSEIINFFLTNYESSSSTSIYFITNPDDNNLQSNTSLKKHDQAEFEINIFYRKNR